MSICVGIAGGTGSGKTTLARALARALPSQTTTIQQDWYYRDLAHLSFEDRCRVNFDAPEALDNARLLDDLHTLLDGNPAEAPCYDFTAHARSGQTRHLEPAPVLLLEGIHVLGHAALRGLMALKIFVDAPADIRFIRRLRRDTAERGRTAQSVITQYIEQVRPMHAQYVEPSQAHAGIVLSGEDLGEAVLARLLDAIRACLD